MSPIDSPDHSQDHPSDDLMLQLRSKTGSILGNLTALLESGAIENEVDRKYMKNAAAFIEKPTENLADIDGHLINIGEVLCGYDMQGMDPPAAIDAMSAHLRALRCINRMGFIEAALENGTASSSNIKEAMTMAVDEATTLAKKVHKDDSLLNPVNELKERAERAMGSPLISPQLLAAFHKVFK